MNISISFSLQQSSCDDGSTKVCTDEEPAAVPTDERTVIPLDTAQLVASVDPQAELELILDGLDSANWYLQYQAIESARRLIVHHSDVICPKMPKVLPKICIATENLRSAMVKNALLAYSEAFRYMTEASIYKLDTAVEALLRRAVCEKKFLRDAAEEALESLVENLPPYVSIGSLLSWSSNKNSKISAKSAQNIAKCFERLDEIGEKPPDEIVERTIVSLGAFRNGKEAAARNSAKVIASFLRSLLSDSTFETKVKSILSSHDAQGVINDSLYDNRNNKGKSTCAIPSIRDAIRRDKAKKEKLPLAPAIASE